MFEFGIKTCPLSSGILLISFCAKLFPEQNTIATETENKILFRKGMFLFIVLIVI